MKINNLRIQIFFLAIFSIISTLSYSQTSSIRNQIFIGARPIAMGEAFLAVADDGNTLYWNPAGLPYIDRYEIYSMRANLFNTNVINNYLSFIVPYSEKIAFGVDWFNLGFGDDELEFGRNLFNFSLGVKFYKGLTIGTNIKRLLTNASLDGYAEGNGSGWGADFGLLFLPETFIPALNGLQVGIMAHDFTDTRVKYNNGGSEAILPRNIRYGLAYKLNDLFFFERPLLAMDIDDRFHFGTEFWLPSLYNVQLGLRAGFQRDIYAHGEKELILSFGTSIKYQFKDRYFVNFDYAYTDYPMLINTSRFSLGFSFSLPTSPVKIDTFVIKDIYASLYPYHAENSIGKIKCKYEDKKKLDIKVNFQLPRYDLSRELNMTLNPAFQPEDTSKEVDLIPIFSEKILDARGEEKIHAKIEVRPKSLLRVKPDKSLSNDFTIYGIGKINWAEGENQVTAFITSNDPIVRDYATTAIKKVPDSPVIITEFISYVIKIFNELREDGISYIGDETSNFSQRPIDTILYPRQLLAKKIGDCDDTTILFSSLLESIGIQTCLICTRDHIFLIMNTELPEKNKYKFCMDEKMLYIKDHQIWIPIETTLIGEKEKYFWDVWKTGAEQLSLKECNFIDVHESWKTYRPIPVSALDHIFNPQNLTLPTKSQDKSLELHNQSIQINRKKYLEDLEVKVKKDPKNVQLYLKLGTVYAMIDSLEFAEKNFKLAQSREPKNAQVLNNLANVYFLKGDLELAEKNYQKALSFAKTNHDSNGIYLNLGTLYSTADSLNSAKKMYAKVIKNNEDIQKVEKLLGIPLAQLDVSKAEKTTMGVTPVKVKRLIEETLASVERKETVKEKDKDQQIIRGLKKSKNEIQDVFYWSF